MIEMTWIPEALRAFIWLYWAVGAVALAFALIRPKLALHKAGWALVVAALFGSPLLKFPGEKRGLPPQLTFAQEEREAKVRAAEAHFEMRCKSAGEKITRTVDNVDGVVWMKWRDKETNRSDQFKLDDPYGRDCGGEDCIEELLRLENTVGRFQREVDRLKGRYWFVESVDPADRKTYRYRGAMVPRWSTEGVKKHRQETGKDIPDDAYWFKNERKRIDVFSARFGITWDDISTREDRVYWIAGGSLKVIDLQNNEVIAERVGYLMDRGLGDRTGARSPWLAAADTACPAFRKAEGGGAFMSQRNHTFIFNVLKPKN